MKTSNKDLNQTKKVLGLISAFFKRIVIAAMFVFKSIALLPMRLLLLLVNKLGNLFRFSLTFKIGLIYTTLVLVVLIVFNVALLSGFRYFMINQATTQIEQSLLKGQTHFISQDEITYDQLVLLAKQEDVTLHVLDESAKYVMSSANKITPLKYNLNSNVPVLINNGDERLLIATSRIKISQGTFYIQVVKNVDNVYEYIYYLVMIGLVLTVFFVLGIVAIGSKISKTLLSPITTMTDQVKAISIKSLDRRLDMTDSQDELKELAKQFNLMLDHIEDAYQKQNQFVSDASHELRTPISVINGYISMLDRWGKKDEAILDEAILAIKGETIQMKELIEKLLFLARSDRNKIEMEIAKVPLHVLVEEICKETKMIDKQHEIICQITGESTVYGNEKLIKQMMRIFIENAIKFTEKDKKIVLSMFKRNDQTVLSIADEGCGIPKEDVAKVFDRFYKADKSRTKKSGGSGLGLSIAKWIIDQHGAQVNVKSAVGIGTRVEITFNEKLALVDANDILKLNDMERSKIK